MEAGVLEYSTSRKQGIVLTYCDVLSIEILESIWKREKGESFTKY